MNLRRRWQVFWNGLRFAWMEMTVRWRHLQRDLLTVASAPPPLVPAVGTEDDGLLPEWRGIYFHAAGKQGSTVTVQCAPGFFLRGHRLIATDTSARPGMKTRIQGLFVGNKPQMATFQAPIVTAVFSLDAFGTDMDLDVCDPMLFITFQIEFLADCVWSAELWGDALTANGRDALPSEENLNLPADPLREAA